MTPRPLNAMVVAHPDDEALWLSSALASVERIVFAFGAVFDKPERSQARQQAVAALPLKGVVNLALPESGVDWKSYLRQPSLASCGVRISEPAAQRRYEDNFARLLERLRTLLFGCRHVFTHNPWGEYGHAEHIQVYRAVTALQEELGYCVWFSNYVGADNWTFVRGLADQWRWTERSVVKPDLATARSLMQTYRHHGAWTWTAAHRWPAQEVLYAQPPGSSAEARHPFRGEWLLDLRTLRWWPPPWRGAWRLLDPLREQRRRTLPL